MAANRTAPNLPLIAVTLFFSVWFATFSYGDKFQFLSSIGVLSWGERPAQQVKLYLMLAGSFLIVWPNRWLTEYKWPFLVLLSMGMTSTYLVKFPNLANHTMMMVLLLVGFLLASVHHLVRKQWRLSITHTDYIPLMRAFLIVMYFWGTFHKINTDFLHPDGCWFGLYTNIPFLPEILKKPPLALYIGGYGTLILEALALLLLLFPRTKYYGMLLGLFFHFLIGIATTGNVAHFSAFAFAMHFSFLSSDAIARFNASPLALLLTRYGGIATYARGLSLIFILTCILLSYLHTHPPLEFELPYGIFLVDLMWWLYATPLMLFVAIYGRTVETRPKPFLHSKVIIANLATLLLIFNSMASYIGLNANADLGMFSNLRTEWGKSNHYIITPPPYLFSQLNKDHYVQLISTNHPYFKRKPSEHEYIHKSKIRRLFHVKRYKDNGAPYSIKIMHTDGRNETILSNQVDHELTKKPSFLERNYLRFGFFDTRSPRPCSSR